MTLLPFCNFDLLVLFFFSRETNFTVPDRNVTCYDTVEKEYDRLNDLETNKTPGMYAKYSQLHADTNKVSLLKFSMKLLDGIYFRKLNNLKIFQNPK